MIVNSKIKILVCILLLFNIIHSKVKKELMNGIAISLKQLNDIKGTSVESDTFNLFGLNKLVGIIKDSNDDLILIGKKCYDKNSLTIDDITSIVNYYRGDNDDFYCEIIPNEEEKNNWFNYLDKVNRRGDTPIQKLIGEWQKNSGSSIINLKGIPFTSHLAKSMIDADIFLKRFAYDDVRIKVRGLRDYLSFLYPKVQKGLERNAYNLGTISHSFWFYAGSQVISSNDSLMLVNENVLRLYSGGEIKNFRGNISTDTNSSANHFVNGFNEKINSVLNEVKYFSDLNEIFKLNILVFQNKDKFLGIWDKKEEYVNYENPTKFETIRTYSYFEAASNISPQGTGISNYSYTYYTVFGGIDMDVKKINVKRKEITLEDNVYNMVLEKRPSKESLCWIFDMK